VVFAVIGVELNGWSLVLPLLVFGMGMGMIFAPLFDIILSGVGNHEIGSASGVLESFQQLGASLGVAVLGTVFFTGLNVESGSPAFLEGAMRVTLLAIGLTVVAFGCGFLLPKRGRGYGA